VGGVIDLRKMTLKDLLYLQRVESKFWGSKEWEPSHVYMSEKRHLICQQIKRNSDVKGTHQAWT